MAEEEKKDTGWENNPAFTKNMGRLAKPGVRAALQPAINEGHKRHTAMRKLKEDIFAELTDADGIKEGIKQIAEAAKKGKTKQLVDIIKILAPKDIDITSGGEKVAMGTVHVNGIELTPTIGEELKKEDC